MRKLTKFFIVIDILIAICFFVVYCPIFKNLQNTIISTAIDTKTHDYIAYTFYSEERVQEVVYADKFEPINVFPFIKKSSTKINKNISNNIS